MASPVALTSRVPLDDGHAELQVQMSFQGPLGGVVQSLQPPIAVITDPWVIHTVDVEQVVIVVEVVTPFMSLQIEMRLPSVRDQQVPGHQSLTQREEHSVVVLKDHL